MCFKSLTKHALVLLLGLVCHLLYWFCLEPQREVGHEQKKIQKKKRPTKMGPIMTGYGHVTLSSAS